MAVTSESAAAVPAGMNTISPSKLSQHALVAEGMHSIEWKQLYWASVGVVIFALLKNKHEINEGTRERNWLDDRARDNFLVSYTNSKN